MPRRCAARRVANRDTILDPNWELGAYNWKVWDVLEEIGRTGLWAVQDINEMPETTKGITPVSVMHIFTYAYYEGAVIPPVRAHQGRRYIEVAHACPTVTA